jgi:hypothetical protein
MGVRVVHAIRVVRQLRATPLKTIEGTPSEGVMTMGSEFAATLAKIRRRRRQLGIMLVAYLPVVATVVFGSLICFDIHPGWTMFFFVMPYIGTMLSLRARTYVGPCPRCHQRFHKRGALFDMMTRSCLHCQLPLDAG